MNTPNYTYDIIQGKQILRFPQPLVKNRVGKFIVNDLSSQFSELPFNLPKVRYVYLVQDVADASNLGGTANNIYTNFQSAYDAANLLQLLLGGSNIVVLKVGNITSAAAGNLTLTANWNRFVYLSGNGIADSNLGNIIATNSGNAFNVGGNGIAGLNFSNIRILNILTNATGTTGNSGSVGIIGYNLRFNIIDTSITNVLNTTGNGGNVFLNGLFNNSIYISTVITSSKSTTSSAGAFSATGNSISLTNLTTANNNAGGDIVIQPTMGRSSIQNITLLSTTTTLFSILNTNIGNINARLGNGAYTIFNCFIFITCTILNNAIGISTIYITNSFLINPQQFLIPYTTNTNVRTLARNTSFGHIINLGNNSRLINCSLNRVGDITSPTINGIGTGCIIKQCTIEDGNFSISNATSVNVIGTGSYYENSLNNVTII